MNSLRWLILPRLISERGIQSHPAGMAYRPRTIKGNLKKNVQECYILFYYLVNIDVNAISMNIDHPYVGYSLERSPPRHATSNCIYIVKFFVNIA